MGDMSILRVFLDSFSSSLVREQGDGVGYLPVW